MGDDSGVKRGEEEASDSESDMVWDAGEAEPLVSGGEGAIIIGGEYSLWACAIDG